MQDPGKRNRLIHESSPYLLQHAGNPVDWYPWGSEAIERARREDRPIFLSIGYSACHWCHVMAHESFEDPEIAALLNAHFVSVKVDREERPDLDEIYMAAVQMMTGQGGWPLSAWLTPALEPFFGGTYFPPEDRYGRAGFRRILEALAEAWRSRRGEIDANAARVAEAVRSLSAIPPPVAPLGEPLLRDGAESLLRSFDAEHGGFGGPQKFPTSMGLQLLLRHATRTGDLFALRAVTTSLDAMARGGIRDHLGGGFHRYSTDPRWLVPHFEKMLYDQALLTLAYLEAHQYTSAGGAQGAAAGYARVVRETLDYVLREMTSPEGAFYSTQDADSEGEEGRFYLWTRAEVFSALGEEAGALFCRAYDVDEVGNFEGRSVLHRVADSASLAAVSGMTAEQVERSLEGSRRMLLQVRASRPAPARDEKILTCWNGLMISALARAGRVLREPAYIRAAERAAGTILTRMRDGERLLRLCTDGRASGPAFLEDYADLLAGLADLYEATFEPGLLDGAVRLAEILIADFGGAAEGGFYDTAGARPDLIVRPRNAQDGSTPSGNSQAAYALLRLGRVAGRADLETEGERTVRAFGDLLDRAPGGFHQMLLALDLLLGPRREIVIAGPREDPRTRALLEEAARRFLPRAVLLWTDGAATEGGNPLVSGKTVLDGAPAAYVCRDFSCRAPVTGIQELMEALSSEEPA